VNLWQRERDRTSQKKPEYIKSSNTVTGEGIRLGLRKRGKGGGEEKKKIVRG